MVSIFKAARRGCESDLLGCASKVQLREVYTGAQDLALLLWMFFHETLFIVAVLVRLFRDRSFVE